MTPAETLVQHAIATRAADMYAGSGKFSQYFARHKLRMDPMFIDILRRGPLSGCQHIMDLGCGQGLLAAWLQASWDMANEQARRGLWPEGWKTPKLPQTLWGYDLLGADIRRAEIAASQYFPWAQFYRQDMARAALHEEVDAVVMLDAMHYLNFSEQEALLERIAQRLLPGGVLLMRICDRSAGMRYLLSGMIDKTVAFGRSFRGVRLYSRKITQWQSLLAAQGFAVDAFRPQMWPPMPNILLHCEKKGN